MKGSNSTDPMPTCAEVVLDLEVEDGRVYLVLANCGDAVATTVVVEFSRALAGVDSLDVSGLPVFARLGVLRDRPFVATVSWDERGRPRQQVAYHHDPSIYRLWPECV